MSETIGVEVTKGLYQLCDNEASGLLVEPIALVKEECEFSSFAKIC